MKQNNDKMESFFHEYTIEIKGENIEKRTKNRHYCSYHASDFIWDF